MTGQLHIDGLFGSTEQLWESVLEALRLQENKRAQEEWLRGSRAIRLDEGELTIELPTKFAKEFMEKRSRQSIEQIVQRLIGRRLEVRFVSADSGEAEAPAPVPPAPAAERRRKPAPSPSGPVVGAPLNRRYSFESFAAGGGCQFPFAAARAVAAAPGSSYNPLFICGGVGVGKTHLLQAIGHEIQRLYPNRRLAYVPADAFTYEWITAIRERRCDAFRKRYRELDVLLVDDIQFIAQKASTEEEFFLTFNILREAGRQIVVAGDRSPKEMDLLDDRLRSRFESGLIVELRPPDRDTRLEILRRKAAAEGANLDEDVLLFVANLVQSNARALEGAFVKLLAYASLTHRPLCESVAREALEGYYGRCSTPSLTVETIQRATCDFYRVDLKAMKSKRRERAIVVPRQVAMYLSRTMTDSALTDIGGRFGGRDHSTVIASCNKVRDAIANDAELRQAVEEISRRLGA